MNDAIHVKKTRDNVTCMIIAFRRDVTYVSAKVNSASPTNMGEINSPTNMANIDAVD